MPAGDGTGPRGMGPMTGRAAGYCAGYATPGYANPVPGRSYGRGGRWAGQGGGHGWRHWYYATGLPGWARFGPASAWGPPPAEAYGPYAAPPSREQELEFLRAQAGGLQEELEAISKRIEELEQQ